MKPTQIHRFCIIAIGSAAYLSCATSQPYKATVQYRALGLQQNAGESDNGVIFAMLPLTRESVNRARDLNRRVWWKEPNYSISDDPLQTSPERRSSGSTPVLVSPATMAGQNAHSRIYGTVSLVTLPSFRVVIDNTSKESLSLGGIKVQIEDDKGRQYSPIFDSNELREAVTKMWTSSNRYLGEDVIQRLLPEIAKVKLLNPDVVVPAGNKAILHLVPRVTTYTRPEYDALMSSINSFSVAIKNVTTSNIPSPSKTDYIFKVDAKNESAVLNCPHEVTKPSFEDCTPDAPAGR